MNLVGKNGRDKYLPVPMQTIDNAKEQVELGHVELGVGMKEIGKENKRGEVRLENLTVKYRNDLDPVLRS